MTNKPDIRERLLKLQVKLQKRLNKTQSEERHEVEEGNDSNAELWETSEIRDGLNDETVTELRDVNRALSRLDAGDYGICTNCGEPIDPRRLEALPYAELCIFCADQQP
jgi:RNA polymerase-binding transcription factor DksA